jgi:hypothetical protein
MFSCDMTAPMCQVFRSTFSAQFFKCLKTWFPSAVSCLNWITNRANHIERGANGIGHNFSPLRVLLEHFGATHSAAASPGRPRGAHVPGRPPVAFPRVSAECGLLSPSRLFLEHTKRHLSISTAEYRTADVTVLVR